MIRSRLLRLPKLTRWVLTAGLVFLLMMTLMRFGLFLFFPNQGLGFGEVTSAFLLGLRYDLRTTALIMLLTLVLGSIPALNPFRSNRARKLWLNIYGVLAFLMLFFYAVDFAHFSYLNQRLNASVLNYLEDTSISLGMVWQSYPVIRLILLVVIVALLFAWLLRVQLRRIDKTGSAAIIAGAGSPSRKKKIWSFVVLFLIAGFFVFGRFNQYPLRWSDAFALGSDYKANLALNPFESFFNSLRFRKTQYDPQKLKDLYPEIAEMLGLPASQPGTINFARTIQPRGDAIKTKPNVVLVICESFSGYKSSMWGNPLNTTPFFDSISKQGLFYDHCFTPTYGTARGVWATITGIPDVERPATASRNPLAVNQRTIINEFKEHRKFYFLGGSSSWANIRGLLTNNIAGLSIFEENSFKSPRIDVWGISDKNLFLEANEILARQDSSFFAVIQTADNHRPYTIPEEDRASFKLVNLPLDSVKKYGFENLEELNAFRYTDYCFQAFIHAASREKYFSNTVFVFVGDHGIPGNVSGMFPKSWTEQRLAAEHVPLLFYAPGMIKPERSGRICSQIDVLPTIAGFMNAPYTNTTLGRDLRDSTAKDQLAFIFDPDYTQSGVVMGDYFYRVQLKTGEKELVSIRNNEEVAAGTDTRKMQRLTEAIHEAAKYLIMNNKK